MKEKKTDKEKAKNINTNGIFKKKHKKNVNEQLTPEKNFLSIDKIKDDNKKVVSLNSTSDNTNIIDNESTDFSDPLELNNDDCHYFIYQKIRIIDPATTIVKQQIKNTRVTILIIKPNIERTLIKLDILDPECSLADILEKIDIKFENTVLISLVEDIKYKINYIIDYEFNYEKIINSHDELSDPTYDTSKYNNALVDRINDLDSSYQNDSSYHLTIDKSHNDDYNSQINQSFNHDNKKYDPLIIKVIEQPKYYDTELAICNHCLYPSINFNHCYYCEKKIECNPKTIPNILSEEQKKNMKFNIKNYYNNWYNNLHKNINNDNIVKQNDENKKTILSSNNQTTNKKKNCDKILARKWSLSCRSIKIGSYNYVDDNNDVILNKIGFVLSVVPLKNKMPIVKVKIKYDDIIEAKFYFNKELNVLFLQTNPTAGLDIRKLLGMRLTSGPIYDPKSEDSKRNMITLVIDQLSDIQKKSLADDLKMLIQKVVELKKTAAHNLLVETSGELQS